jgi:hypothetical protein
MRREPLKICLPNRKPPNRNRNIITPPDRMTQRLCTTAPPTPADPDDSRSLRARCMHAQVALQTPD